MTETVSAGETLARLQELIAAEGGELAAALVPPAADGELSERDAFGALVAACERTQRDPREYALVVEAICEGYLLHYWEGRLLRSPDEDLRLLAGDFLYAFGLSRLALLEDIEAVSELSDLIALCAGLHTIGAESAATATLAAGAWGVCALGVGGGSWAGGEEAKKRLRAGAGGAEIALVAAEERARELGTSIELERALIAFKDVVSR